jgi:hypothetical protein
VTSTTQTGPVNGTAETPLQPRPSGGPPRPRPRPRASDEVAPAPSSRAGSHAEPIAPDEGGGEAPSLSSAPAEAEGNRALEKPARVLPRLSLAPLEPAELLYERLHEPSADSPILYRERAYVVDALQTDDDLEEHLEAELSRIRRDWRHRDASQFVQLALYDHQFQGEPHFPPIATLSWKDWQGRSEIWVRGVRRSTMPPGMTKDSNPPVGEPDHLAAAERRSIESARELSPAEVEAVESSTMRPSDPEAIDDDVELLESDSDPIPLVARVAAGSTSADDAHARSPSEPVSETSAAPSEELVAEDAAPPSAEQIAIRDSDEALEHAAAPDASAGAEPGRDSRPPDSGPGWQSPDRSGEYLIPLPEEAPRAPSSQRVLASDELIGLLFERMHELAFAPTISAGADYVLGALAEHIPCDGALIHVLDVEAEELVVMRALGPDCLEVLTRRTPAHGSHLGECLRRRATLELGQSDIARERATWQTLGVIPRHVIASPIVRQQKPLGVIELGRVTSKGAFNPGQVRALEYVCEQFAEFVGDRPIDLARSSLLPHPLP